MDPTEQGGDFALLLASSIDQRAIVPLGTFDHVFEAFTFRSNRVCPTSPAIECGYVNISIV